MTIARELRDLVRLRGGDVSKVPDVIADNVRALKKLEQEQVDAQFTVATPTPLYIAHSLALDDDATADPSALGWYERSGEEGSYVYTLSTDTEMGQNKYYYEFAGYSDNPSTKNWYEKRSNGTYFESEDTTVDLSKTYFINGVSDHSDQY